MQDITQLPLPQKVFITAVTMGGKPSVTEEKKRRILHCKTVQSLLNDKKRLYNLRHQDAFSDISLFQKFSICHCIVFSLRDGSEEWSS